MFGVSTAGVKIPIIKQLHDKQFLFENIVSDTEAKNLKDHVEKFPLIYEQDAHLDDIKSDIFIDNAEIFHSSRRIYGGEFQDSYATDLLLKVIAF